MSKRIKLTKGMFAIIDDEDFEIVSKMRWHAKKCGNHHYAAASPTYRGPSIYLHRLVMKAPKNLLVDHVNSNTLDDRKSNLRLCAKHQNLANRGLQKNNTVGFKGVCFHGKSKTWNARVKFRGKSISVGYHKTPEEAARHYNLKVKELFGEFAFFNKVEPLFPTTGA